MDRGAWRAPVQGVSKSQTRPKHLNIHSTALIITVMTIPNDSDNNITITKIVVASLMTVPSSKSNPLKYVFVWPHRVVVAARRIFGLHGGLHGP